MTKRFLAFALILFSFTHPAWAEEDAFTLYPGDVLQITVWKEDGMDREVLVLPDGSFSFPLVGTLMAKGLTIPEVEAKMKEKLKDMIPDASISVAVKSPMGHSINVIGQVAKPGEQIMNRKLTVMQALSQAGGLTPFASDGGILVLRHAADGQETSIEFPYSDVAGGDNLEKDIALKPGDVVMVPTATLF